MAKVDLGLVVAKPTIYKKEGNILCYEFGGIKYYRGRHYVTIKQGYIDLPQEFDGGTVVNVQATPSSSGDNYFCSAYIEGNRIRYTMNQIPNGGGVQLFLQAEKYK